MYLRRLPTPGGRCSVVAISARACSAAAIVSTTNGRRVAQSRAISSRSIADTEEWYRRLLTDVTLSMARVRSWPPELSQRSTQRPQFNANWRAALSSDIVATRLEASERLKRPSASAASAELLITCALACSAAQLPSCPLLPYDYHHSQNNIV